jgi:riboflavin kinase/FMN adenylyltransferase
MQVHFGIELLRAEWNRAVGCVGTFDGVHLGHRAVICEAVRRSREQFCPSVLVTFDRHPAAILAPDRCPPAIAPLQENLRQFERLGVSVAIILQFNAELSRMSAQRFLTEVLQDAAKASELVVGHDFAMGNNREGSIEWLKQHTRVDVVPPFEQDGVRVSSSEIRRAIAAGEVAHAAVLLGRPFAITGVVIEGEKLGRTIGYPTANIARSFDQAMPRDGVYAGWFECDRGRYQAAVSIGTRPTVGGQRRTIEAFLLDYSGESLYGESVRLEMLVRLRDEVTFGSLDALATQIGDDVAKTRQLLNA